MHACGHEDVTTYRHGTWDYNRGQQAPEGYLPHTLGWGAHRIGILDRYGSPTKCKKVRSCDICIIKYGPPLCCVLHHFSVQLLLTQKPSTHMAIPSSLNSPLTHSPHLYH